MLHAATKTTNRFGRFSAIRINSTNAMDYLQMLLQKSGQACYCYYNQDSTSSRLLPGSSYSCCIRNLHALVHRQCTNVLAHWAAGCCRAAKSKIEYHMVWYESKLSLVSLGVNELSLPRAAAFNLQMCPFLNSTPKPPHVSHYICPTDRHVLAIMQADLCRAHPYNPKVMSLCLLKPRITNLNTLYAYGCFVEY
jgi:hypothetical protein